MANSITMREMHANLVNQFEEACIDGRRPSISEMISNQVADPTALLADLIDLDMEFRWKANEPFQVERYFETFPVLKNNEATSVRLVQKELDLRRRTNQPPLLSEYHERFPKWAEQLTTNLPSNMFPSWLGKSRMSPSAVQQVYADVSEQSRRTSYAVKQRLPAGADAEKSRWLTETINELFDPQVSDEKQYALFANDNRALANELFARWSSKKETLPDPTRFFLRMAESIRAFLMQQAKTKISEQSGSESSADCAETTLAFVLAEPQRACDRDVRWELLRAREPSTVYDVKLLEGFAGRTPGEITLILDLSGDQVDDAIREGDRVLQSARNS